MGRGSLVWNGAHLLFVHPMRPVSCCGPVSINVQRCSCCPKRQAFGGVGVPQRGFIGESTYSTVCVLVEVMLGFTALPCFQLCANTYTKLCQDVIRN